MKLNKKAFFRIFSVLILLLALTFSSNAKANSPIASSVFTNMFSTTVDVTIMPVKIHSLTGGFWSGIKDWLRNRKKNRRTHTHYRGCGHNLSGGSSGSTSDDSSDGGNNQGGGGSQSIPLDGGLGILALAAAAFGVRKLRGNKHDKI